MSRLTRDGTAEPISLDQFLRCERGQGNTHFPCSADHEQDWQLYPVDAHSCFYVFKENTIQGRRRSLLFDNYQVNLTARGQERSCENDRRYMMTGHDRSN